MKLQRNALSVIEAPTGNEVDDQFDFENGQSNASDLSEFLRLSISSLVLSILLDAFAFCDQNVV